VTIYVGPTARAKNLGRLIAEKRLRPDPKGEIEVLNRFWDIEIRDAKRQIPRDTVPPLLAYADLIATLDPRNAQVARELYARWIANDGTDP